MKQRGQERRGERMGRRPTGRAFTLIEMMVAVGAVALVAVGLAAIFDAVGKTVSAGARSSEMTQFVAMLDTQFRKDLSSLTRDGPMVIRQQYVDRSNDGRVNPYTPGTDAIEAYPDQPAGARKVRRIDELVFFRTGEVTTARPALHPDRVAKSSVSRVYYGHGMRYPTDAFRQVGNTSRLSVSADAVSSTGPALAGPTADRLGFPGLNQYPRDWMLLRQQTLLIQPARDELGYTRSAWGLNVVGPNGADVNLVRDRDYQIGWQPAARHLFRTYARADAIDVAGNFPSLYANGQNYSRNLRPSISTGVVDIATTDLREVRQFIGGYAATRYGSQAGTLPRDLLNSGGGAEPVPTAFEAGISVRPARTQRPGTFESVDYMHAWMEDLMPTESAQGYASVADFAPQGVQQAEDPAGSRIRYEPDPPGYLDALVPASPNATTIYEEIDRVHRRMLTGSNFVPHCTQFIVEWTLGLHDKAGNIVWYGPERPLAEDRDGDGTVDVAAVPYPSYLDDARSRPNYLGFSYSFVASNGTVSTRQHAFTERLFYGYIPRANDACLTTYFGYVDPTFDRTGGGTGSAQIAGPVAWPWPKAIRIILTLADPRDPSREETFEFVYDLPPEAPRQ